MDSKPNQPLAELRKLLFNISDIYSEWYFYSKELLKTTGMIVNANNIDLEGGVLEPVKSSKYPDVLVHIKVKKIKKEEFSNTYDSSLNFNQEIYVREFFPSLVFFPGDVLRIESMERNVYKVFLREEDQELRPLVELAFLEPDRVRNELIKRINLNIRLQPINNLRRFLESFEIILPTNLNNEQLWDWLNQQDPFKVWQDLDDLQKLYEFNLAIVFPNKDIYHLSLVDTYKQDLLDYMKN